MMQPLISTKLGDLYSDRPCFIKIVGSVILADPTSENDGTNQCIAPPKRIACVWSTFQVTSSAPPSKPCCQRYQPVPAKALITVCTERERRILPIPVPNIRILNPSRSRSVSNYAIHLAAFGGSRKVWVCSPCYVLKSRPQFLIWCMCVQIKKSGNTSMANSNLTCFVQGKCFAASYCQCSLTMRGPLWATFRQSG